MSYTPPSFNKKRALSVAEVPETSTFYPVFTSFQVVFLKIGIFTHYTLHLFFIFPLQRFFEISTFYHIFTIFNSEVCNISNKCLHPNKLVKHYYLYLRYLIVILHLKNRALHREGFSKHLPFITFALFLTMSMVCNISKSQINTDLLIS